MDNNNQNMGSNVSPNVNQNMDQNVNPNVNQNMDQNVNPYMNQNMGPGGNQFMNQNGQFGPNGNIPPYMRPPYNVPPRFMEPNSKKAEMFRTLFGPTLLYAVLYSVFLFKNLNSITVPMFVLATLAYIFTVGKRLGLEKKKSNCFYGAIMLLLGISSAITASTPIVVMNYVFLIITMMCMLLQYFYDDSNWGFCKHFTAFFQIIFGAIGCIPAPFSDGACNQKEEGKATKKKMMYVFIGVFISIPLLIIIITLLYYSDAVFASVIDSILKAINLPTIVQLVFTLLFSFFSAYCGIRYLSKKEIKANEDDHHVFNPVIAITVLVLLSIIYVLYSGIQIIYLFLGQMQLPDGYTYASYAHEGFFQLAFVCVINVILVLLGIGLFKKNGFLDVLLAIISVCTYIMLASSAYRMCLYIGTYGMTFARLFVLALLIAIAVLFVGIFIQIFNPKFKLFKYGILTMTICYMLFSFMHPDYWIAYFNLNVLPEISSVETDYGYITRLSADAAPVIGEFDEEWTRPYIYKMAKECPFTVRKFNVSKAIARSIFKDDIIKYEKTFCLEVYFETGNVEGEMPNTLYFVYSKQEKGKNDKVHTVEATLESSKDDENIYVVILPYDSKDEYCSYSAEGMLYNDDTYVASLGTIDFKAKKGRTIKLKAYYSYDSYSMYKMDTID